MADKYIAEDDESEDSEDNHVDEFIDHQYLDFQTHEILEKQMRQKIFMMKENYDLFHRFANILKINCYDKEILLQEEVIKEKDEIR